MASENKKFSLKLSKTVLYFIQVACAVLGLAISLYLVVQHTRLKSGIQGQHSFCYLGEHADCDAVNISDYAELLGIPLASYGAAFYFLILILGIWARPRNKGFHLFQRTITWLALVALFVDVGLLGVQIFRLHNFCILCGTTYIASIGIFLSAALLQSGERAGSFVNKTLLGPLPDRSPVPTAPVLITAISLVVFVTAVLLIPPSILEMKSGLTKKAENDEALFFNKWKEQPVRKIPVKDGDGTFGNSGSKVQIVEFSDFQCPFCQKAAFVTHEALQNFGDRVYFVFKNFPLDSDCNKAVSYQMHRYACRLARLAYCAGRKGKFWDFHDIIFMKWQEKENQKSESEKSKGDAVMDAVKGGMFAPIFNEAEYNKCLADNSATESVKADADLGAQMGITGTPTIYINGKLVSTIPFNIENLKKLIELEESLP